jgi:hypothetical protein
MSGRLRTSINGAGIDVSLAVRDYLGLRALDVVDWRFVEQADVLAGPWPLYEGLETTKVNR